MTPPTSRPSADGRVIVLLDIDGTLLHARGAGRLAFSRALAALWGWRDDIAYINFSGATDLDVLQRILARHGHPARPSEVDRFFDVLAGELDRSIREHAVHLYPGVRELLEALSADPRAVVGLVTGNTSAAAHIKLRAAGLDGHFLLGAFGHEHADRVEIARLALSRARRMPGAERAPVFLIGDTPADVAAARGIGAVAVAVATGAHPPQELRDAGADVVYETLAPHGEVLRMLGLG